MKWMLVFGWTQSLSIKMRATKIHWIHRNLKHGECSLRLLSEVLIDVQACAPLSVMPMSCWLAPGWSRWMRQYGPCQELSLTCWADDTQHKCDPVGLIPHSTAPTNISCLVLSIQSQTCWEQINAFHFMISDLFHPLLFIFQPVWRVKVKYGGHFCFKYPWPCS